MASIKPAKRRFLRDAAITKGTRTRYVKALAGFVEYCERTGETLATPDDVDEAASDYLHERFELNEGKGKSAAAQLPSALAYFAPDLKGKLVATKQAVRGWERLVPTVSYPPLTWELCCAMAVELGLMNQERCAVAILLQFDCLLRVSELVNLRTQDIVFEGDARMGKEQKGTLVVIRHAKTGKDQSVFIDDPDVVWLLRQIWDSTEDDEKLFPFSAEFYRKQFKLAAARLGLSDAYTTHSCRHGGATRMYLRDPLNIKAIMVRGRWAQLASCQRYIQAARARLAYVKVPTKVAAMGDLYARNLRAAYFEALTQRHW